MISYHTLKKLNEKLEKQKEYILQKNNDEYKEFFFASDVMRQLMKEVELIAPTDSPVLITGETGTGKDHIARYIHALSLRNKQLFVKVNCAALAPTLIESELFGHAKGSFTGAAERRIGRFEMAKGGTVFLDEISELPIECQAKLLQVLEEKTFERVGESVPITVDFRVISATNQDIKTRIREKRFRRDLFYRLNIIQLHIPPLRERIEDIPLLVMSFTTRFAQKWQKREARYSSAAMQALCNYPWPGNVRELRNVIERIMILRAGHIIHKEDVNDLLYSLELDSDKEKSRKKKFLTRQEMEKRHIEEALAYCGGIIGGPHGAARLLGMPRTTLQYRMKKLGINLDKYSPYAKNFGSSGN
jgi:formate hydrogenlyase transcriptional activator